MAGPNAPASGRGTRVAVGAAFLALGLTGCGGTVRSAPVIVPEAVQRVFVDVDHGNVEIVAGPEISRVEIQRTTREVQARGSQHAVKDGVLRVEGRCGGAPKCRINHRIRVPPTTAVTVHVRDGDVALIDVGGDIEVDVGLGNVSGLRLTGPNIDVVTEGGNVDLILNAAPTLLAVQVAAGDIDLRVPPGEYRCALAEKSIPPFGIKCAAGATRQLSATTAVGRLSVHATD